MLMATCWGTIPASFEWQSQDPSAPTVAWYNDDPVVDESYYCWV
jgi:hypothetical protein